MMRMRMRMRMRMMMMMMMMMIRIIRMWQYRIQVHFLSGTSLLLYPHCFFYPSQWITANIHKKLPYFQGKCMVSGRCSYLNPFILVKFCGETAPSPADLSGAESGRLVGEKTSRQSRDRLCRAGEVWTEFGRGLEEFFFDRAYRL